MLHPFAARRGSVLTVVVLGVIGHPGCPRADPGRPECEGVPLPCSSDLACDVATERCDIASCTCVPACSATAECRTAADCVAPMVCGGACTCVGDEALDAEGLATLTGTGLAATCHFVEERDCSVATFDAAVTVRIEIDGTVWFVQNPGAQTSTGALENGVRFSTRDSATGYDEVYLGVFDRTAGTAPTAPLTPDTVVIRGLEASGAEGALAPLDAARITAGLRDGAHTGNTAAIDSLFAGTTGVCTYDFDCTFVP